MVSIAQRHLSRLYIASQALLLLGALWVAVLSSSASDWQPPELLALLFVLSVVGEWMTITIGNQTLSASFIALVLAMILLGPAPAAAIGIVAVIADSAHRRPPLTVCLANLAAYTVYLVAGGLLARAMIGDAHAADNQQLIKGPTFALVVFVVFIAANLLNFAQIAIQKRVLDGRGVMSQVRTLLIPMLPGQLAAAVLAALLAASYTNLGYPVLLGVVIVIVIFQYLAMALLRSEDRAERS